MNFDQFKAEWLGKRIDYDHVYGYQCVDLVLQYLYECFAIPKGVWGNAVDYWHAPSGPLLSKFNKIGGSDAQKGDIVVLNGLPGNPYGHIGIATGNINATQVEILEQNGGGGSDGLAKPDGQHWDEIGTRYVARSHVLGLLRPMVQPAPGAPTPAPKPAPLPPPPNPPPVYKPPAAPAPISYAGAGTPYTVVVPLKGYPTATQAGNQTPNVKTDTVPEGEYVVYRFYPGNENLVNITLKSGSAGWWINNELNKVTPPPPPPEPTGWPAMNVTGTHVATPAAPSWQDSYRPFPTPQMYYVCWGDTPVVNGDTGASNTLTNKEGGSAEGAKIMIAGTVTYKDNRIYYRRANVPTGAWALIPVTNEFGLAYLESSVNVEGNKPNPNRPSVQVKLTEFIGTIEKVMDVWRPKGKK